MRVDLSLDNLNPNFLNESKLANNYVEEDGFFRPATCLPQHKVAIIIPYRDREQHLHILLKHLHGVLQRQLLLYKVFVIEQVSSSIKNIQTLSHHQPVTIGSFYAQTAYRTLAVRLMSG